MAERTGEVLPTEIDMSWAYQNPAPDSAAGEHLQAFTAARSLWADAIGESWSAQVRSAQLHDEASTLLGLSGDAVQKLERNPEEQYIRDYNGHTYRTSTRPAFLGRTSLLFGGLPLHSFPSEKKKSNKKLQAYTEMDDSSYLYGVGTQAMEAAALEAPIRLAAKNAATSLREDSTIDPVEAVVWSRMLRSDEKYAQIDPEWFATEALSLVVQARQTLGTAKWLAVFQEQSLVAVKLANEPIITGSEGLQVGHDKIVAFRTSSPRAGRGHETYLASLYPEYPKIKDPKPIGLLPKEEVKYEPSVSFGLLRAIVGEPLAETNTVVTSPAGLKELDAICKGKGGPEGRKADEVKLALADLGLGYSSLKAKILAEKAGNGLARTTRRRRSAAFPRGGKSWWGNV